MKPAISLDGTFLVCDRTDEQLVNIIESKHRVVRKSNGLLLCQIEDEPSMSLLSAATGMVSRRYLDKFHLLVPENDSDRRQKLLDEFFSLIADNYESLIDRARNLDNILNLLSFIKQYLPDCDEPTILDYGCGTGLSCIVAKDFSWEPIGLDRCPAMRAIASHRGMKVWNAEDLARQPIDSIDASFASYVFHLLPDTKSLEILWARIRPGGVLVANFHKDAGESLVEKCVSQNQCSTVKLLSPNGSQQHGSYFAFLKR